MRFPTGFSLKRSRLPMRTPKSSWSVSVAACADIDTGRCPLFLLSGEYDYSCTPEETLGVARRIPGCEATIMKGLGHFPMSENPGEFLKYLLPVLERIAATSADAAAARP